MTERFMLDADTAAKLLIVAVNDRGVAGEQIARGRVSAVVGHPTDSQRVHCVTVDPLRTAILQAAGLRVWAEKELPHKLLIQVANTTLRHVEVFPIAFQMKRLQEIPMGDPLRGVLRTEVAAINLSLGVLYEEEMRELLRGGATVPGFDLEGVVHSHWLAIANSGTRYFAAFAQRIIDSGLSFFVVPTLSLTNILQDPATREPVLTGCALSVLAFSLYYRIAPYLTRVCDTPCDDNVLDIPSVFSGYLEGE